MIMIIEDVPSRTALANSYDIQNIKHIDFKKISSNKIQKIKNIFILERHLNYENIKGISKIMANLFMLVYNLLKA